MVLFFTGALVGLFAHIAEGINGIGDCKPDNCNEGSVIGLAIVAGILVVAGLGFVAAAYRES